MKRLLIAPAHYLLSDKYGSEPLWAYEILTHLSKVVETVDVICGVVDIKTPLPKNVNLFPVYKCRSSNVYIEFLKRILFYPLVFLWFIRLHIINHYRVVHHLFPLSIATLNPIVFFGKLFGVKKIILGPLQLPQTTFSKKDLKLVLVGNSKNDWSGFIILPMYLVIIFILKPLVKLMFRSADVVICNAKSASEYYSSVENLKNTVVIPTGITLRKKVSKDINKKISILCVGQLSQRKGQLILVDAYNRLTEEYGKDILSLTLVGEGDIKDQLVSFIKEHKIKDQVFLNGPVDHNEIWSFYDNNLIYCLPSISDPSPTVILEAMMSGMAIVASDVGAVAEILGDTGVIVASNDVQELVKGLEFFIVSPNLVKEYGYKARARIESIYDWRVIISKYLKIYES
jgi:glycosyltransferase involved in cell wall biosynthesis